MNPNGGIDMSKMSLGKLESLGKTERAEQQVVPMSERDMCFELGRTVKCKIAPSKVHGVGVVAMRDIAKGEQAYCALTVRPTWYKISMSNLKKHLGEIHPEILQLILDRYPQVVNGAPFLSPNYDARLTSFMNHSDTPNYDPRTDLALADIKEGEELFEDYRVVDNYEKAFPFLKKKE